MPITAKPSKPPLWATNPGTVIEPTDPKKQSGWAAEKPPFQYMNWIHNTNYLWQQYFENYFDTISTIAIFDDSGKTIKTIDTQLHVEKADSQTNQAANSMSSLVIRNTNPTVNNFSDLAFFNKDNLVVGKISSKNIDHTNNEGEVSIWTRPNAGTIAQRVTVKSDGKVGIGTTTPETSLNISGAGVGSATGFRIGKSTDAYYLTLGQNSIVFTRDGTSYIDNSNADGKIAFRPNGGSTSLMTLGGGHVGIGTTSPVSIGSNITTVHIMGTSAGRTGGVRGSSNDSSYEWAIQGASSGIGGSDSSVPIGVGSFSSHAFGFFTGNTTRMVIGADGRIKIGGNSINSTSLCQIGGHGGLSGSEPVLRVVRADGGGSNAFDFVCDSNTNKITNSGTLKPMEIGTSTANDLKLFTNNSIRLTVLGTGEIGIGTTSPNYKLDISAANSGINLSGGNSRIYFGGYRALEGNQDGTLLHLGESFSELYLRPDLVGIGRTPLHNFDVHQDNSDTTINISAGVLSTQHQNPTLRFQAGYYNYRSYIRLNSTSGHTEFADDNQIVRAVITQAGRIGFGTTSPDARLHIEANVSGPSDPHIKLTDNGDSREASIYNISGDLILGTHETDNVLDGFVKIFEGGAVHLGTPTVRLKAEPSGRIDLIHSSTQEIRLFSDSSACKGRMFSDQVSSSVSGTWYNLVPTGPSTMTRCSGVIFAQLITDGTAVAIAFSYSGKGAWFNASNLSAASGSGTPIEVSHSSGQLIIRQTSGSTDTLTWTVYLGAIA